MVVFNQKDSELCAVSFDYVELQRMLGDKGRFTNYEEDSDSWNNVWGD